jgi:subtilisin family serine protease
LNPPLTTLRRAGTVLLAGLIAVPFGAAHAQRPTVSPAVDRALARDTVVAVWLFLAPEATLEQAREAIEAAGGRVRRESVWLHAVSANIGAPALGELRRSALFRHVQPVARFRGPPLPPPPTMPRAAPPAPADQRDSVYGPSAMPYRQLNAFGLADRGFRGAGVRIAILDTGFETELAAFDSALVVGQRDFVGDSLAPGLDSVVRNEPGDVLTASQHGTAVWSLLAAHVPGVLIGMARDAEYILAKTEDVRSETRVEEDNYVAALEWAHSLGAHIASSSLGYLDFDDGFAYTQSQLNGDIAVTTVAADLAAQRGILVVTSVGNGGPNARTLSTPADGDSVVAVGAEDSLGFLAGFSSRGPTADGRIKPDLLAPGVSVWVLDTQAAGGFNRFSGTSFAAPLLAAVSALFRQIHPSLGPIDVLGTLRRTGTSAANPDPNRGWGRPDALAAASFPNGIVITQPTDTMLGAVTPTFAWATPGAPAFALPMTFRLTVTRNGTGSAIVLDTVLTETSAVLRAPQRPGTRLAFTVRATAADSATFQVSGGREYLTPPWVDLLVLDDPAGLTIRERRPRFTWAPTPVTSPPGPYTHDVEVLRADDGLVEVQATGIDSAAFTPDAELEVNTPYHWRVRSHLGADTATTESRGVFVIVDESIPTVTLLFQNFPNPFPNPATGRSTTCIWFDHATAGQVRLEILDLRGHVLRRLIPGPASAGYLPAGRYGRPAVGATGQCDADLAWDGRAEDGSWAARGVYLIKLQTPDGTFFKRAVFLGPS